MADIEPVLPPTPGTPEAVADNATKAFDAKQEAKDGKSPDAPKDGDVPKDDTKPEAKPETKGGDTATTDGAKGDDSKSDDDGYFAADGDDELDEPDTTPPPPADTKNTDTPAGMSAEQSYIYENLPIITVRGTVDGKAQNLQVKVAQQLPEGFEFANKREELIFNQAIAEQAATGVQLRDKYTQEQSRTQLQKFNDEENTSIRQDIDGLQRDGSIPKFKLPADDPKFSDDAGAKVVQEVLDYYNKENEPFMQGKSLYRVTFKQAYRLFQADQAATAKTTAQGKEDADRKKVSRETGGAGEGATPREAAKSTIRRGTTAHDLINRFELMDFSK